jgi:hypothetical protein
MRNTTQVDFFIGEAMDYIILRNVMPYFPKSRVVSKNKEVQRKLMEMNVSSILWPTFPDVVIMARHALYKYPHVGIVRICLEHGPYIFKNFIAAKKYNLFDLYFFTSKKLLKKARKTGIVSGEYAGYPKLDNALNGSITPAQIEELKSGLNLDTNKSTILFSATWDKSGMSAINKWHHSLDQLVDSYNILVTLHPFMSKFYVESVKATPGVIFIEELDMVPYLMLSDVLVSDTSSIIAEFCALDKPIITFSVGEAPRLTNHIRKIIKKLSIQISEFHELPDVINKVLIDDTKSKDRMKANKKFFTTLDGKATERAVQEIHRLLAAKGLA